MALMFCRKCKTLMSPSPNKKFVFVCPSCGYEETAENLTAREKIPKELPKGEGFVEDVNEFATYTHTCKKCGHDKVQVIDLGVFYSDEDHIIFLKCGKCGWTERLGEIA